MFSQTELTSKCSDLDQLKEENKRLQESLKTQLSHSNGLQKEVYVHVHICIVKFLDWQPVMQ